MNNTITTKPENPEGHLLLVRLAREIAVDHYPVHEIIKRYGLSSAEWLVISTDPNFIQLLNSESLSWQSAMNTEERTKLKAAAMIEEWLPEANTILHAQEPLTAAKVELVKTIARIGALGLHKADIEGGGERFSVTINLGQDAKLSFNKDKVIEGSVND